MNLPLLKKPAMKDRQHMVSPMMFMMCSSRSTKVYTRIKYTNPIMLPILSTIKFPDSPI